MHGQTAAAAPQIVEYAKESFADQETWEVCGAPKNDTPTTLVRRPYPNCSQHPPMSQ